MPAFDATARVSFPNSYTPLLMPASEKKPALFTEFKTTTAADWAAKVQRDLKGEPAILNWQTDEGLLIKPCYHPEDLAAPAPVVMSGQKQGANDWQNIQAIWVGDDARATAQKGTRAFTQGADGLHFIFTTSPPFEAAALIKHLAVTSYPVSFTLAERPAAFLENLYQQLAEQNIPAGALRGFVHYEPAPAEKYTPLYYHELQTLLTLTESSPDFYALTIDGRPFAANGGTVVQEIGFTIGAAVAALDELTNRGVPLVTAARNVQLQLAVGTNYFFEIAKLRAVRLLWANVLQAYGLAPGLAAALRIQSETSRWYQTTFDPHSNLLRATTEAMAAVIGGCDSLVVRPFDITIQPENAFAERLARNVSLILREEAHLHQISDPAAGSYYLETLTAQLADEAWQLFQDVETQGGFVKAWQGNRVKAALHAVAREKFKKVATGDSILVGTNKFINPQEKIDYDPEALLQSRYFDTTRAAYSFEVMRFAAELHYRKRKQKPRAVVAAVGDAIQRQLNATFVREFFACAGFQIEMQHFASVAAAETALPRVSAEVIILSASEVEYETFARHLGPALKTHPDKPALVLAANPQHMKEELRAQGFDEFLFQGCDTVAIVGRIQKRLQKEENDNAGLSIEAT